MRVWVTALLAGIVAAALVAGFPAFGAADHAVAAVNASGWNPSTVTIDPGDSVTWSNGTAFMHNVCVAKPGDTPASFGSDPAGTSCTEFRNGVPASDWSVNSTNSHLFATAGTYSYICQQHTGMKGTVQVGPPTGTTTTSTGTGTTTSQTTTTQTQTQTQTQTSTTQTQTQTGTTPAADTTAPRFTTRVTRRASRTTLILKFGASEDATLKAKVARRAPGARSFTRVGSASLAVHAGANTVRLPRKASGKLRSGAYRVTLTLVDDARNASTTRTLVFKLA
ncbi:MAG: plastocyanin/azurin family copper-binding protein [Thermoleophilaceae bacterium]